MFRQTGNRFAVEKYGKSNQLDLPLGSIGPGTPREGRSTAAFGFDGETCLFSSTGLLTDLHASVHVRARGMSWRWRMDKRLRVALLFGGRSAEHDVSILSAGNVFRALDPSRYEVLPIAITRAGSWLLCGLQDNAFPQIVPETGP